MLTERSTIGTLFVDGVRECVTLEDRVRAPGIKVAGETAIPAGTYRLTFEFSPRLKRETPRLQDVPGFTGVLIHAGNAPEDSEGCILVGRVVGPGPDRISESRLARDALEAKIRDALARGEAVAIRVEDVVAALAEAAPRAPVLAKRLRKRPTTKANPKKASRKAAPRKRVKAARPARRRARRRPARRR